MSAFVTHIPVNIDETKKLLPADTFIESVDWNPAKQQIEIHWSNRNIVTPFTFHTPFPLELLKEGKMPECAVNRKVIPVLPPTVPETEAKIPVDKKHKKSNKLPLT